MNFLGKSLVMIHAILSVGGMTWAILLVVQGRDFGWAEPYKAVLKYDGQGNPTEFARYASEYDKSWAVVKNAERVRNRTYAAVEPAIDSLRNTEPFLANNHLHYVSELRRLREASGPIKVARLDKGGLTLDVPELGKPVPEDPALDKITKSYRAYKADLKKLIGDLTRKDPKNLNGPVDLKDLIRTEGEVDAVHDDIRRIVKATKDITFQMTGRNEANEYIQPGLYELGDLEFKAQSQLKDSIDEIKPHWSKAVEQSRLFRYRRNDLEATLEKLKGPPPAKKNDKKI
jgi:hypothetical protein